MIQKDENFTENKDYYFIDFFKSPRILRIKEGEIISVKPYKDRDLGKIYLGQVDYKLDSLSAYFVNLGKNKRGFLQEDLDLKSKDQVLVQVAKEAYGKKDPGLTTEIALQGTYLVHFPKERFLKYSNKEKKTLKATWKEGKAKLPPGGWLIRTGAFDLEPALKEAKTLYQEGQRLLQEERLAPKAKLLYEKSPLEEGIPVFTNNEDLARDKDYSYVKASLYHHPHFRKVLEDLDKEVLDLDGLGQVRLEKTQACTTLDVDSKGKAPAEEVNLLAAKVLGRQVLWRDLRGMFVVDFITTGEKNRQDLENTIEEAFKEDPQFISYGFSKMGLYEFVRMRKEH